MQDPYSVLGISPSASEDEIKKAYRSMARKYHPDVNGGSAQAEQKMKEVNEAYSTIMKMRKEGTSGPQGGYSGYSGGGYGGNAYSGNTGYGNNAGGYQDPFNDFFRNFGGYGYNTYANGSSSAYGSSANPLFSAARNYIQSGHYREAMNTLEGMQDRSAEWYYLMAQAAYGMNNRTAALNYARQASNMEPNNLEYQVFLSRLEGRSNQYQQQGAGFRMNDFICGNPLMTCCLLNMLCNCCCCGGGRC